MKPPKIIYSLNIEDVQNVAEEEFERELTKKELKIVEDKVGDYIDWHEAIRIDWHEAIRLALNDAVKSQRNKTHGTNRNI